MKRRERLRWGKMKRAVFQWTRLAPGTIRCGPATSGQCWLANWKALPRQELFVQAAYGQAPIPHA